MTSCNKEKKNNYKRNKRDKVYILMWILKCSKKFRQKEKKFECTINL